MVSGCSGWGTAGKGLIGSLSSSAIGGGGRGASEVGGPWGSAVAFSCSGDPTVTLSLDVAIANNPSRRSVAPTKSL